MCVIGIKYQFITLHNNTNIPCRLKKKRKERGGGGFIILFFKCHKALQQQTGHGDWRSSRSLHKAGQRECPLLLSDEKKKKKKVTQLRTRE